MRVDWSRNALDQVHQIFEYIAADRPLVATDVVHRLFDTTGLLGTTPEMGPRWKQAERPGLRFIVFETYRIVYRVDEDRVFILSVRHTRRTTDCDG